MDSGRILFSHNANARLPMASTTKIMTAILVLESLALDDKVTISGNAAATDGSKLGLEKGEVLTVEQLLYACWCRAPTTPRSRWPKPPAGASRPSSR